MNAQEDIKKISIEQRFSDLVFKRFRSDRFGITYCCPLDLDKYTIKKELCDWEESRLPVYLTKTYAVEEWIPGGTPMPAWGWKGCCASGVDPTCIYFVVINQNGNPIEGYNLVVDGGNVGSTDENGELRITIENASVAVSHILDLCYCFSTKGACSQLKITITLTEECPKEECQIPTKVCDSETETVTPIIPEGSDCTSGCTLPMDSIHVKFGVTHDFVNCGQVIYNISQPIGGFEFTVEGGIGCGAALDGDADTPGFTVIDSGCDYLGTSFIGTTIPAGCGTLTYFLVDAVPVPTGVSGVVFVDAAGEVMPITVITDCL